MSNSVSPTRSHRTLLGAILVVWCACLVAGAQALWRYSVTPGEAGPAPKSWPVDAPFQRQPGRPTLVMLAHPRCPCTRASLAEFARLVAQGGADACVLFLRPEGAEPGWEHTSLWNTAESIPGVRVLADVHGTAARTFGAETSGHVLFYDAAGTLRFSGGITASRGHEGPSVGGESILAALQGGEAGPEHALTFGCPLLSPETP